MADTSFGAPSFVDWASTDKLRNSSSSQISDRRTHGERNYNKENMQSRSSQQQNLMTHTESSFTWRQNVKEDRVHGESVSSKHCDGEDDRKAGQAWDKLMDERQNIATTMDSAFSAQRVNHFPLDDDGGRQTQFRKPNHVADNVAVATIGGSKNLTNSALGDPSLAVKLEEGNRLGSTLLMKDNRLICPTKSDLPISLPSRLTITSMPAQDSVKALRKLTRFTMHLDSGNNHHRKEWSRFLDFLRTHNRVAIAGTREYEIYIFHSNDCPPGDAKVDYRLGRASAAAAGLHVAYDSNEAVPQHYATGSGSNVVCTQSVAVKKTDSVQRNFVRADPSYLKTLGQTHSGWIFGAIAELVDNSSDAKASRLSIKVEAMHFNRDGVEIPVLSIIDDGCGMNHQEIVKMISFGHKGPDGDLKDHIGRFGIGFKTGAMRLGKDALVLTQTAVSRSIAFLSQSLNNGKENLEVPIVSYYRKGQSMELDTNVQSEASAKHNLNAIKEFTPFSKFLIGEKVGLFGNGTGTQIYIWNLDMWGSNYSLEWETGVPGKSSFHQGDIYIRSRRVRSRPGQVSKKIYLDYSLRSYLEVIFLVPRMKIQIQGSPVKCRPLAKSLGHTVVVKDHLMGKPVELTLGKCQLEWENANCGIFIYWHNRLIEAYKRVGGMIHSADMGRGVIGVIDATEIMDDGNGVNVHNNKQGFLDCEAYAVLEQWLARNADEYWDKKFGDVQVKKGNPRYKPDHEWVQCDKCRKWRILDPDYNSKKLGSEWFCYMEPYNGTCDTPQENVGRNVITINAVRSGYNFLEKSGECGEVPLGNDGVASEGTSNDDSSQTPPVQTPPAKRLKRSRRGAKRRTS